MKANKSLLIIVSVFLLISLSLISAAIYLYVKKPSDNSTVSKSSIPSAAFLNIKRDSLQKIYTNAIKDLDTALPAVQLNAVPAVNPKTDSIHKQTTDINTADGAVEKLRNEINTILQNKSSDADLEMARMKIGELQTLVNILKNKNTDITKENERLYALLKQLAIDERPGDNLSVKNNAIETNYIQKKYGWKF